MILRTRAPAKINLTLHVVRRRADGFHDLESLVAFAGVSDILDLDPSGPLGLDIAGPTADNAGPVGDNLVLKAARALGEHIPGLKTGLFRLTKRLPVGAGIGGGSSDAAAGLRLLARLNDIPLTDARLHAAAAATGSDVPVCVSPRSRMMRGTGDRLSDPFSLPPLFAVLVNPGIHLETRAVFSAMGWERGQDTTLGAHLPLSPGAGLDAFVGVLKDSRNDMQAAAGTLAPDILQVLEALHDVPGARLSRMSGSGSTCFALFESRSAARGGAERMRARFPAWWVRATALM